LIGFSAKSAMRSLIPNGLLTFATSLSPIRFKLEEPAPSFV